VTYNITWPTNAPALQIGETLLTAKRGLPAIENWASAQVAFDTLNPNGSNTLSTTARLYDPISARTLRLTNVAGINASYRFPADVSLQTQPSGAQTFSDLPYYLRVRLSYHPASRTISWSGVMDESSAGEPLLLINVMSDGERQRIKELTSEAKFHSIIDALYDLTRNPNRIDRDRDGAPDQELLIGFTTNSTGAIVLENLGDLPKALTAGACRCPAPPMRPARRTTSCLPRTTIRRSARCRSRCTSFALMADRSAAISKFSSRTTSLTNVSRSDTARTSEATPTGSSSSGGIIRTTRTSIQWRCPK
jgi:hypothetical protein